MKRLIRHWPAAAFALTLALCSLPALLPPAGAQDSTSTARRIRETSGPTLLTVGAVADGQFLKRAGSTVVGAAVPAATPGGSSGDIQYNNAGAFGGLSSTGTGNVVRATGPTLTTPNIGDATGLSLTATTSALGLYAHNSGNVLIGNDGSAYLVVNGSSGNVQLNGNFQYTWPSAGATGSPITGLAKIAARVTKSTDGSTGGGAHMVGDAVGNRPTCSVTIRGALWSTQATAGNGDTVEACLKGTADTYSWRTVFTAP